MVLKIRRQILEWHQITGLSTCSQWLKRTLTFLELQEMPTNQDASWVWKPSTYPCWPSWSHMPSGMLTGTPLCLCIHVCQRHTSLSYICTNPNLNLDYVPLCLELQKCSWHTPIAEEMDVQTSELQSCKWNACLWLWGHCSSGSKYGLPCHFQICFHKKKNPPKKNEVASVLGTYWLWSLDWLQAAAAFLKSCWNSESWAPLWLNDSESVFFFFP